MNAPSHSSPLHPLAGAAALLAALAAVAALAPALTPLQGYRSAFALTDQVQEEVNTSAFATILGEMRASMADLMWVKTERYLHRGVAYKPHIDQDAMAQTGEVVRQDAHGAREDGDGHGEHHHHGALQALVPEAGRDYRGFIGTLQRAVQPWKGPGAPDEHTAGDELVPWYRLLTLSDPHHWRGYMIGTWWLSKMKSGTPALAEAGGFIEEGIRNNPDVFQLQLMAGRVKIQQRRWAEAIGCFTRAAALARKVRPAGGQARPPAWSDSDEEDFAAALRYIPSLQWRKLGDARAAAASVARGLSELPKDGPLLALKAQLAASPQ